MNLGQRPPVALVVDDKQPIVRSTSALLEAAGYEVLPSSSGTEALHLAESRKEVDILVTDLEMPGMRGDELASRLATLHPETAVVIVSGSTGPIETSQPYEFLAKPFRTANLYAALVRAQQRKESSASVKMP